MLVRPSHALGGLSKGQGLLPLPYPHICMLGIGLTKALVKPSLGTYPAPSSVNLMLTNAICCL